MKENRSEIEIQSTPERVWEVLTDLRKYPEWNPLLIHAEGKLAVGEKVNLTAKSTSSGMKLLCTVTTVEPNRQFSWKFHVVLPFLFRGEHFFQIEPINDHKVRFIDREIFHGLLVPLQAKNLETNAKPAMVAMGEALKRRAEGKIPNIRLEPGALRLQDFNNTLIPKVWVLSASKVPNAGRDPRHPHQSVV